MPYSIQKRKIHEQLSSKNKEAVTFDTASNLWSYLIVTVNDKNTMREYCT